MRSIDPTRRRLTLSAAVCGLWALAACVPTPTDVTPTDEALVIYPDYRDVTLPCNIAPLNFMLRQDEAEAIQVEVSDRAGVALTLLARGHKAVWDDAGWRQLLATHHGDSLHVSVTARIDGQWLRYPTFGWYVSADSLDSYLTYRLIEPGYEVWDNVCIEERCTETFDTRLLADGRELGNRCMNCHTHGGDRGQYSFMHLRGKDGGTLLCRDGQLRKLTLRKEGMQSGAVYGDFHPTGRYAVYSTNVIIPAFHTQANRRLEVYDTTGDLCVADFNGNTLDTYADASTLMSFPCFSADGRWIYYCAAPNPCGDTIPTARQLLPEVSGIHYSLCRIAFDAATGRMDPASRQTLYDAQQLGGSVSLPKCSPDGRYLAFCLSAYGTFPIWHRETRLCLLPLDAAATAAPTKAPTAASTSTAALTPASPTAGVDICGGATAAPSTAAIITPLCGTYHSWSHNSRWLAFASKREDGQYGRTYFVHIDDLLASPPAPAPASSALLTQSPLPSLVLPQSDPAHDDHNLRSYNIPDLSTLPMPFGHDEVKMVLTNVPAEPFR